MSSVENECANYKGGVLEAHLTAFEMLSLRKALTSLFFRITGRSKISGTSSGASGVRLRGIVLTAGFLAAGYESVFLFMNNL